MSDAHILPFPQRKPTAASLTKAEMDAFCARLNADVFGTTQPQQRTTGRQLEMSLFQVLGGILPSDPLYNKIREELGFDP